MSHVSRRVLQKQTKKACRYSDWSLQWIHEDSESTEAGGTVILLRPHCSHWIFGKIPYKAARRSSQRPLHFKRRLRRCGTLGHSRGYNVTHTTMLEKGDKYNHSARGAPKRIFRVVLSFSLEKYPPPSSLNPPTFARLCDIAPALYEGVVFV